MAVLRELRAELGRRADLLKRHGVSRLADLPPNARPGSSPSSTSSTCCSPATTRWPGRPST
ncbi:hypothetical protein V2I01_01680 [Micromonospora sp. BRA006-A]|nr:hypothetical protein [Micromonospora sp. BRA006-A]